MSLAVAFGLAAIGAYIRSDAVQDTCAAANGAIDGLVDFLNLFQTAIEENRDAPATAEERRVEEEFFSEAKSDALSHKC
jgi:hypothetical protein